MIPANTPDATCVVHSFGGAGKPEHGETVGEPFENHGGLYVWIKYDDGGEGIADCHRLAKKRGKP